MQKDLMQGTNNKNFSNLSVSDELRGELEKISRTCIKCKLCQSECAFLKKYGKPKDIADSYVPSDKFKQDMCFECSLCGLCAAVCPVKIDPAEMFLAMRREAGLCGKGEYPEHQPILGYEKKGISPRFTFYSIPKNCDTVFFPGCTLPGTRPDKVLKLYEHMKKKVPDMGIVLDCCTKPSHDLGRMPFFNKVFGEMLQYFKDNGIRNVLVACPNCYKVFHNYGNGLNVSTVYQFMSLHGLPQTEKTAGEASVHDSCACRYQEEIHGAVRDLAVKKGITLKEMKHSGPKTLCCGEGGAVGLLSPGLAKTWGTLRKEEACGTRLLTYCAGCANFLNSLTPASHILDLIFEPDAAMAGRARVSKAPFTYLNRIRLKKKLQEISGGAVTRERTLQPEQRNKKSGMPGRLLFLGIIIAAIFAIRFSGVERYLGQDALRELIRGYGALAPAAYILIYTLAPALFVPGLPLTIAGGILFGPLWGVIYAITGATSGACVAFLVSRYIARDWIQEKLKGPRWRRLDRGVEEHGWKIVAFTRLIPLFPFNLLNYAFGLTKIRFLHYAVATFICMLPACIAFIVFSSSLLDLFRGKVSPAFLIGLGLIVLVSAIPVLYRAYKKRKGGDELL